MHRQGQARFEAGANLRASQQQYVQVDGNLEVSGTGDGLCVIISAQAYVQGKRAGLGLALEGGNITSPGD